jgi:hypothetical protein
MKSNMLDSTASLRNEVNVLEPEPGSLTPRGYPRVSPGINFSVMVKHTHKRDREYYKGIIEDVSLEGMFIEIDHPFPKDNVVIIKFQSQIEKDEKPVTAKGLVRWTRKWRRPHGMGIDFIEFEGLEDSPVDEWFKKHFQQQ